MRVLLNPFFFTSKLVDPSLRPRFNCHITFRLLTLLSQFIKLEIISCVSKFGQLRSSEVIGESLNSLRLCRHRHWVGNDCSHAARNALKVHHFSLVFWLQSTHCCLVRCVLRFLLQFDVASNIIRLPSQEVLLVFKGVDHGRVEHLHTPLTKGLLTQTLLVLLPRCPKFCVLSSLCSIDICSLKYHFIKPRHFFGLSSSENTVH